MTLVAYDKAKLRGYAYRRTDNMLIIEEFLKSEFDCAKVDGWTQSTAGHCAGSLNNTIKLMKVPQVKAVSMKGEVFLVKIDEK